MLCGKVHCSKTFYWGVIHVVTICSYRLVYNVKKFTP